MGIRKTCRRDLQNNEQEPPSGAALFLRGMRMFQLVAGMFIGAVIGAFAICLFVVASEDGWRKKK